MFCTIYKGRGNCPGEGNVRGNMSGGICPGEMSGSRGYRPVAIDFKLKTRKLFSCVNIFRSLVLRQLHWVNIVICVYVT